MQNQAKDVYIASEPGGQLAFEDEELRKLWDVEASSSAEVVQAVYPTLSKFIEGAFFFATIFEKVSEEKLQSDFDSRISTYKGSGGQPKSSNSPAWIGQDTDGGDWFSVRDETEFERKLWRDIGSGAMGSFRSKIESVKEDSWYKRAEQRATSSGQGPVATSQFTDFSDLRHEYPRSSAVGFIYLVESSCGAPGEVSIGVMLEEKARGKGFARQAMELVLKWIFDEIGFHRVQAICLGPSVTASSMAFFIRMGFNHEGTRRRAVFDANTQKWLDATYLAILDTEWLMRGFHKPAPKTLWDELINRHFREREELLCWEGKEPKLKRRMSMETITGAPDPDDGLYASDEEPWSEWEKDESVKEKSESGREEPARTSSWQMEQANLFPPSSSFSLHTESESTLRPADSDEQVHSPPASETWSSDGFDLESGNESESEEGGLHSASNGSESAWEVITEGTR